MNSGERAAPSAKGPHAAAVVGASMNNESGNRMPARAKPERPTPHERWLASLSGVRSSDLLWQAKLVLSTLHPQEVWTPRLKTALRQGDVALIQAVLEGIYRARAGKPIKKARARQPEAPGIAKPTSTILPPSPLPSKRAG